MQPEEAIERQSAAALTGSVQGELAPQLGIIAVAERRHRGEPIECTAHDHQHEARGTTIGVRKCHARAEQCATRGEGTESEEFTSLHRHGASLSSAPHELGRSEQQCERLRRARRMRHRLARRLAEIRAEQLRGEL